MPINYVTGDATAPAGAGNKIIAHICNDIGAWGKGFVLAVGAKYPEAEQEYKRLFNSQGGKLILGTIQCIQVRIAPDDNLYVCNMIGQRKIRAAKAAPADEVPPIRYDALYNCLDELGKFASINNASVHCPRIGAGLAGGHWGTIEAQLEKVIIGKHGRALIVYDLPTPVAPPATDDDDEL